MVEIVGYHLYGVLAMQFRERQFRELGARVELGGKRRFERSGLLDASGAGKEYNRLKEQERWHAPPKQKIWLICTLSCPWGYEGWGQTIIRCNTREGWQKKTEYGKFHT